MQTTILKQRIIFHNFSFCWLIEPVEILLKESKSTGGSPDLWSEIRIEQEVNGQATAVMVFSVFSSKHNNGYNVQTPHDVQYLQQ